MRIFAFPGSLRRESLNRKLAQAAVASAAGIDGVAAEFMALGECDIPLYSGDLEETSGVPEGALCIARRMTVASGVIVASPEYNGSMPGVLKNAFDWLSRVKPDPFDAKPFLIMAASPGRRGGRRVIEDMRGLLMRLGAKVHADAFSLPYANDAFGGDGRLISPDLNGELERVVGEFVANVKGGKVS